jgi:hypothetical protein
LAGNGDPPSPMSLPVGYVSPVVWMLPEQAGGLVFVWVYLVFLSLFYQNKLNYVSPCGRMLQKAPFADGLHLRSSHSNFSSPFYYIDMSKKKKKKTALV